MRSLKIRTPHQIFGWSDREEWDRRGMDWIELARNRDRWRALEV